MKSLRNRALALLLAAMLPLSLTACASGSPAATAAPTQAPQSAAPAAPAETPETGEPETDQPEAADAGGILIAYFTAAENSGVDAVASASYTTLDGEAVGRVQALAERIQQNVGGDLFSIRTSVVYPADGGELIDYAAQEQEENARPELTTHIENLDGYDTIFIGYPNWWADLPMAVYSFFDEYDFSGKTIIPFNTHEGSRDAGTYETIQKLEPNAKVLEGLAIRGMDMNKDQSKTVRKWLDKLGF